MHERATLRLDALMRDVEQLEAAVAWNFEETKECDTILGRKLVKKLIIPLKKFPQGERQRLRNELVSLGLASGCFLTIRGRGGYVQTEEDADMPQHVHLESFPGGPEEQFLATVAMIKPLLNPPSPDFEAVSLEVKKLALARLTVVECFRHYHY